MTEDLYTANDVKRVREELIEKQGGIDPILKVPFKEKVCVDHDHTTQKVRGALGLNSNAFEGKVFNAFVRCLKWQTDLPLPEVLINLADYLRQDTSGNPHHPAWLKRVQIDFNSLQAEQQRQVLVGLNCKEGGKNSTERKTIFKKRLLDRQHTYEQVRRLIEWQRQQ